MSVQSQGSSRLGPVVSGLIRFGIWIGGIYLVVFAFGEASGPWVKGMIDGYQADREFNAVADDIPRGAWVWRIRQCGLKGCTIWKGEEATTFSSARYSTSGAECDAAMKQALSMFAPPIDRIGCVRKS
jgi:hypothetical protein